MVLAGWHQVARVASLAYFGLVEQLLLLLLEMLLVSLGATRLGLLTALKTRTVVVVVDLRLAHGVLDIQIHLWTVIVLLLVEHVGARGLSTACAWHLHRRRPRVILVR